jgi:polyhydroxyalkanoate synthesis regulator phasin
MRENTIIQTFQDIFRRLALFEQSMRLGITGESIRNQALQDLLVKKGVITEPELTDAIGAVIKKAQQDAEDAAKKAKAEIAVPTAEQVSEVQKGTLETPTTPQT